MTVEKHHGGRLLLFDRSDNEGSSDGILREWELTSNSTRHDRIRAAPSDADLLLMRIIWSAILFVVTGLTFVLLLGILTAPAKVRKNTFNTYLLYLVIPDFVFSFCCLLTCVTNSIVGLQDWMCQVQHLYLVFGTGANCWLNAVVAWQLYRLLHKSKFPNLARPYKAPTHKDATRHAMYVYAGVVLVACLYYIPTGNKDPLAIVSHKGMFCFPGEASRESSLTSGPDYLFLSTRIGLCCHVDSFAGLYLCRRCLVGALGGLGGRDLVAFAGRRLGHGRSDQGGYSQSVL